MGKWQSVIAMGCFLLFSIFLSGCATYQWQKYGANQSDLNRDSYECQTEAARTYPRQLVTTQGEPLYGTPSTTTCYGNSSAYGNSGYVYGNSNVNCTTTPGQKIVAPKFTRDVNAASRAQSAQQCMYARGWRLVQDK